MHDARKYLGLRSEQTVMVGDTMETDIIGGISMGYKTILVLTGATHQENLHNYICFGTSGAHFREYRVLLEIFQFRSNRKARI